MFDRIKHRLAEMGIDTSRVTPQSSLVSLDIDSLETAQLILDLEEEFGVEIPDDDLHKLVTLDDIANYVNSHSITR